MTRHYFISETGRVYVDANDEAHRARMADILLWLHYRECTREEYEEQARKMRAMKRRKGGKPG